MKNYPIPSRFALCAIPLLLSLCAGLVSAQTVPAAKVPAERVVPLEVVINGMKSGTWH